eukprot:m.126753 g.126753  ORF g.126753 m.126753 type:complete len:82 (+) comp13843_c0_seq1:946-1191(+)
MICVAYTAPMVDSGRRLELRMYLSSSDDLPEKAACSNSPSINHTNQLDPTYTQLKSRCLCLHCPVSRQQRCSLNDYRTAWI